MCKIDKEVNSSRTETKGPSFIILFIFSLQFHSLNEENNKRTKTQVYIVFFGN